MYLRMGGECLSSTGSSQAQLPAVQLVPTTSHPYGDPAPLRLTSLRPGLSLLQGLLILCLISCSPVTLMVSGQEDGQVHPEKVLSRAF